MIRGGKARGFRDKARLKIDEREILRIFFFARILENLDKMDKFPGFETDSRRKRKSGTSYDHLNN